VIRQDNEAMRKATIEEEIIDIQVHLCSVMLCLNQLQEKVLKILEVLEKNGYITKTESVNDDEEMFCRNPLSD
jgi:predicted ArsR family transcriptional regulator